MEARHDLFELMQQMSTQMAAEYARIRARVGEDPGTAGDQGEENWAELLRRWLPSGYHVVTKGRVISSTGETSGQLDVFVLGPQYPRGLLDIKLYLASGVLAAFECKNTLRRRDVRKALQTSARLNELSTSDPSVEHRILCGLIAHTSEFSTAIDDGGLNDPIGSFLHQASTEIIRDPLDHLDLVCVADAGTWHLTLMDSSRAGQNFGNLATAYSGPSDLFRHQGAKFSSGKYDMQPNAIGRFLALLLEGLAQTDGTLRPMAKYFYEVGLMGLGAGYIRNWILKENGHGDQSWISDASPKGTERKSLPPTE